MSAISRSERAELWAARLERFSHSRLSVSAFCASESVSVASFYLWRRRLAAAGTSERLQANRPLAPHPASPQRSRPVKRAPASLGPHAVDRFAELQVIPADPIEASVCLPGNIRIELGRQPEMAVALVREVLQHVGFLPAAIDSSPAASPSRAASSSRATSPSRATSRSRIRSRMGGEAC